MVPDIYTRVVEGNKNGTMALLEDAGYECPSDPITAANMLADFVKTDGEEAKTAICMIHPDKDAILACCGSPGVVTTTISADGKEEKTIKMGCDSCQYHANGKSRFHADASDTTTSAINWNYVIAGSAAVIAIGLIALIVHQSTK